MSEALYLLRKLAPTSDVPFGTIYDHDETESYKMQQLVKAMMTDKNVDYLAEMIIAKADPLRNGSSSGQRMVIVDRVHQFLRSWVRLGKFESPTIKIDGKIHPVSMVSPVALRDYFNTEFITAFGNTILPPSDVTNVTSVVNPDGLFAQQDRIIKMNAKPVPFYERAIYRRLNDWNLDLAMDETENPFYRMDKNPRITDQERSKTDRQSEKLDTYLDREGLSYRMIPKY